MRALIILFYFYFGFHIMVTATTRLSVQTHKDSIRLSWNQTAHPPEQWTVIYNVMGTNYHSVLKIPGNQTTTRIDTTNYPGVFYKIKLYSSINSTETSAGIGFGISDCSNSVNATLGSSYPFESFGYPGGLTFGAICTWNFIGSEVTWFKIPLEDFDIGKTSCNSYLNIGDTKICGNDTVNETVVVKERQLSLRLNYREITSTRGIKFTVSAIHRLEKPENVTARLIGDNIHVKWQQPSFHPDHFTYMLRISHYPFTSHLDLEIDGNKTSYSFEVTSHRGQNFSVQLQSVSNDLKSNFTGPVFTPTNCNKDVFLRATETFIFQTEQYPHHYLGGLSCHFRFQTEVEFRLLILTNDIDIGGGKMCDATYLFIDSIGRFCADNIPPTHLILKKSSTIMVLATGSDVIGRGVNISITSVANPPSVPHDVRASNNADSINVVWSPPLQRQAYVKGYKVEYFIAPRTPGATVSVDKDIHNITISTHDHPGRLFAIRIAGYSDGGVGSFSHPFYVRAGCGRSIYLSRHETIQITSPIYEGGYEADVVCHWTVQTESPLWMKITVEKLTLEDSVNCTSDYVNVTAIGRLCGSRDNTTAFVVKETKIEIIFRTDYHNEGEGFSLHVEAVGCAPGIPESINVTRAGFSVMVNWTPPRLHRRFVAGYIIHYKFHDETVSNASRVDPDTMYFAFDMTSYPGRLVDIWIQAFGDTESSIVTNKTLIRTKCGRRVYPSSLTYISSPYFQNNIYTNLKCVWSFEMRNILQLEMTFLRLNLNNKEHRCDNHIRLNNHSFCDDSTESEKMVLNSSASVVLELSTGPSGRGAYFLLKVEPVTKKIIVSDTANIAPSCCDSIYSSTPILMTSYLGTLLATSLLMYPYEDHLSSKPSGKTKISYQNSFPTYFHDSSNIIKFFKTVHILTSTASNDVSLFDSKLTDPPQKSFRHSSNIIQFSKPILTSIVSNDVSLFDSKLTDPPQKSSVNALLFSTIEMDSVLDNKKQRQTGNQISPTTTYIYLNSFQFSTTMAIKSRIRIVSKEQTLCRDHISPTKTSVSDKEIESSDGEIYMYGSNSPGKHTLSTNSVTSELYFNGHKSKTSSLDMQTITHTIKPTTVFIKPLTHEVIEPNIPKVKTRTPKLNPSSLELISSLNEERSRNSEIKPSTPKVESLTLEEKTNTLEIKLSTQEVKSITSKEKTRNYEIKPSTPGDKPITFDEKTRHYEINQSSPIVESVTIEVKSNAPKITPTSLEVKPNIPEVKLVTAEVKTSTREIKQNTHIVNTITIAVKPSITLEVRPKTPEVKTNTLEKKSNTIEIKPITFDIKPSPPETKPVSLQITTTTTIEVPITLENTFDIKPTSTILQSTIDTGNDKSELLYSSNMLKASDSKSGIFSRSKTAAGLASVGVNGVMASRKVTTTERAINCNEKNQEHNVSSSKCSPERLHHLLIIVFICIYVLRSM